MRKIFFFFAAMMVAITAAAQTDFSTPYSCAADDAVLSGSSTTTDETTAPISGNLCLVTADPGPNYLAWIDVAYGKAVASWTVTTTKGCYVSVSLDLGSAGNNKHIFQVKILQGSTERGTVAEGASDPSGGTDGYPSDINKVKDLDGTILLPEAGEYTIELRNERGYGKGAVKNVILTYVDEAPSEVIEVSSVTLDKTELALQVEEVEQLTATVLPDNAYDPTVTWSSSNEAVATVDNGFITAIAVGNATITATAGAKSATCDVTVSAISIPEVELTSTYTLEAKVAHIEGKIGKKYEGGLYKIYGKGNQVCGNAFWTIRITNPCILSASIANANGDGAGSLCELDVFKGEDSITTVIQPAASKWWSGVLSMNGTITLVEAGEYTFRLRNTQEYSVGKTSGIMLSYEDEAITLYLKAGKWYTGAGNEKFGIYVREEGWWPEFMTQVSGDLYSIPFPASKRYLNFVRFNGEADAPNDSYKWNDVVDLNRENDNNCMKITDWSAGQWRKYFPTLSEGYYLVGTHNSWEPTAADKMTVNPNNDNEFTIKKTVATGDQFKAISLDEDQLLGGWYPEGSGNEYTIPESLAGKVVIYFKPAGDNTWSEENGGGKKFLVVEDETTSISNTAADGQTVKFIQNGMLFIQKNNHVYNVLGEVVK